jgi:hypothetical protein
MNRPIRGCFLAMVVLLAATAAAADDLSGADRILCTSVQATRCSAEGDCVTGPPWNWNIPQFIEVDLDEKTLGTTEASGENRVTPIKNIEQVDGRIFLQGAERGRAFSFVIAEDTGRVTVAVATDGLAVTVFGACTPMPR